MGFQSNANGAGATAYGANANATGSSTTAVGPGAQASGNSSTSIGNGSQALADSSYACGDQSTVQAAAGPGSIACGYKANVANGTGAVSLGHKTEASGTGAVAIGDRQNATGKGAVAIGDPNTASGEGAVALGANNTALGDGSVALGRNNLANGSGAVALGDGAQANKPGDVALGSGSTTDSTHTGQGTQTLFGANVAGKATTANGVMSVGASGAERQIQNVAAGQIDKNSTDAVNGSQLYDAIANGPMVYTDASGNKTPLTQSNDVALNGADGGPVTLHNVRAGSLGANSTDAVNGAQINKLGSNLASVMGGGAKFDAATGTLTSPTYTIQGQSYSNVGSALGAVDSTLNGMQGQLVNLAAVTQQLGQDIAKVQREERGGIAAVGALVSATMPSAAGRTSWAANVAQFKNQTGIGFSFAHRLDVNGTIAITGGIAISPGTTNAIGRAGLMGEF